MNRKIIRWGIIGCGDVTEVKSGPAYQLTDGFELKAVMRRDAEKLKDYAQRHHIEKIYTDANDLINDNEIDAIYIATPPDSHKYYALKVANAKKPCCIEKPLAPNYADSLIIHNAFKEKKTPLFVAYYRRSLPRFNQIKQWLNDNLIGDVRHVNWNFSKPPSELDLTREYNWRTDSKIAKGGYFDDLASHGIDLFNYLLGDVKDAKGFSINQQKLYSAHDTTAACWLHENGIIGSGSWNFGANENEDNVNILGSKGSIEFSIFHDKPVILKNGSKTNELLIENPKHIQKHHVENLKNALFDSNFEHPSTGISALHTSLIIDKILGRI